MWFISPGLVLLLLLLIGYGAVRLGSVIVAGRSLQEIEEVVLGESPTCLLVCLREEISIQRYGSVIAVKDRGC